MSPGARSTRRVELATFARYNALRMARWIFIASHLLMAGAALAQEADSPPPDEPSYQKLEQLVKAASRHSPGLRAARHRIEAAHALLSEAKGSPFFQFTATGALGVAPDVRGTALYTDTTGNYNFSSNWNVVAGVDVSGVVPLYTFGKLRGARDAARGGIEVAEGDRGRIQDRLRFDVRRAYFALQFSLDVLQLISEGKGRLDRALQSLRERIDQGDPQAREEDVWRLSSTIAEIEAREAQAIQLEESSRAALSVLAGLDEVRVVECPSELIEYTLKPLDFYLDAARLHRPEGRVLRGAIQARKSAAEIASARFFPDLGLMLGIGRTWAPGRTDQLNAFAFDPANRGNFSAGLAARWNLDFWGHHFKTQKAEAELDATRAMRDEANDGIAIEVTAAYEEVKATKVTEVAWGRGHRDTRAWFLAATQAYQIGANEPKDVVDAVRAYFKARAAHLDAIREHNTGLARLERTTGMALLPELADWEPTCE